MHLKNNAPPVLISIINWNSTSYTNECVKALYQKCIYPNKNIFVTDNASSDHSIYKIKEQFEDIIFNKSDINLGYAEGHQKGVDYALENGYEYIWILNNDVIVEEESLGELVNTAISNENNCICGSYIKDSNFSFRFEYKGEVDFPIVHGCSMLIPMHVIRKYGFMKPDFFLYGEEVDYCIRLYKQGINAIGVPGSIVQHITSASTNSVERLKDPIHYYKQRNTLRIIKEHTTSNAYKGLIRYLVIDIIKDLFKKLIFYKEKGKYNKYNYYAVYHAMIGKWGKFFKPEDFI